VVAREVVSQWQYNRVDIDGEEEKDGADDDEF